MHFYLLLPKGYIVELDTADIYEDSLSSISNHEKKLMILISQCKRAAQQLQHIGKSRTSFFSQ
jgi:hypothetical protein